MDTAVEGGWYTQWYSTKENWWGLPGRVVDKLSGTENLMGTAGEGGWYTQWYSTEENC